jgi:hypothetical protein
MGGGKWVSLGWSVTPPGGRSNTNEPRCNFASGPQGLCSTDQAGELAAQLDEFCEGIMSCRVVVDVPHRRTSIKLPNRFRRHDSESSPFARERVGPRRKTAWLLHGILGSHRRGGRGLCGIDIQRLRRPFFSRRFRRIANRRGQFGFFR